MENHGWLDEQMYQELFAICQAFSGPGSTKMHYCINLMRNGFIPAAFGFLIWRYESLILGLSAPSSKGHHAQIALSTVFQAL